MTVIGAAEARHTAPVRFEPITCNNEGRQRGS
jgi:hypothetical protein